MPATVVHVLTTGLDVAGLSYYYNRLCVIVAHIIMCSYNRLGYVYVLTTGLGVSGFIIVHVRTTGLGVAGFMLLLYMYLPQD